MGVLIGFFSQPEFQSISHQFGGSIQLFHWENEKVQN